MLTSTLDDLCRGLLASFKDVGWPQAACLAFATLNLLLLPGCSQQEVADRSGTAPDSAASQLGDSASEGKRFDKQAAAALSLANAAPAEFESEYARAVACSGAIQATIGFVRDYQGGLGLTEMQMLESAEQIYRENALRLGAADGVGGAAVRGKISESVERGRESAAAQVQLGMDCLRRLAT